MIYATKLYFDVFNNTDAETTDAIDSLIVKINAAPVY